MNQARIKKKKGISVEKSREDTTAVELRFYKIYTTLRERICLLEYAPGKRLSEEKLASEFGVSRTPVRRVLARLEDEGLVEIRHGAGTFVTDIEPDYLKEVYQLRMELVSLMGSFCVEIAPEDLIHRMQATEQACLSVIKSSNPRRMFALLNIEYFEELMALIVNRPLAETLRLHFYRSARIWPYLMEDKDIAREAEIFRVEISESIRVIQSGAISSLGFLRRSHIAMGWQRLHAMEFNRV